MKYQSRSSAAVEISDSALTHIRQLVETSTEKETGGILVGFNHGRDIVITHASDAGPNAQCSQSHFLRDTQYCRGFLAEHYEKTGADYVGEWHSHVVSLRRLSAGDMQTLAGLFVDSDYDFLTFAIILVVVGAGSPELVVYVAERLSSMRHARFEITQLFRGPLP